MDIAVAETLPPHFLFELGLDVIERQVFPTMFCLELRKGEPILQAASNLPRKLRLATAPTSSDMVRQAWRERTLLTSARLSTLSATSSGCRLKGDDIARSSSARARAKAMQNLLLGPASAHATWRDSAEWIFWARLVSFRQWPMQQGTREEAQWKRP